MKAITALIFTAFIFTACSTEEPTNFNSSSYSSSEEFTYCDISGPNIAFGTDVSDLEPNNWSEYCDSFVWAYRNMDMSTGVCSEFWSLSDNEIVNVLMSSSGGNNSRDEAIGLIDAMWVRC